MCWIAPNTTCCTPGESDVQLPAQGHHAILPFVWRHSAAQNSSDAAITAIPFAE